MRLLVPIIFVKNHNRYNIMGKGHNYSIDIQAIEDERMVHKGEKVVTVAGSHSLHLHEKLAIAVSKAMHGHSLQETKKDGRFHLHTKMYLDGAILKEEMDRYADVLHAGLLEVSDPSLSNKFFMRQAWMDGPIDSFLKRKPYNSKTRRQKNKKVQKKLGDLQRTYGTRVVHIWCGSTPYDGRRKPFVNKSFLGNRISGTIPEEIGDISTLEELVLEDNLLGGPLPQSLGRLSLLRRFRIDESSLSGSIPDFIGNWTNLTRIDLQGTSMAGPIPPSISLLTRLKGL